MYSYVLARPISDTDTGDNMGLILCIVQLLLIATVQAVPQICCHVDLGSDVYITFLGHPVALLHVGLIQAS